MSDVTEIYPPLKKMEFHVAGSTTEQDERHVQFARMLQGLSSLGAIGATAEETAAGGAPSIVQTHASAVLLVGATAYKLKKPNDFGFFNYSTPELRRHFCTQEVLLNRRLAPDVYRGVAPVLRAVQGGYRVGRTFAPDEVPQPGVEIDGGTVIDFAVVMVRLPEQQTLASHVANGTATTGMMDALASRLAAFHADSRTNAEIAHFGSLDVVGGNWRENFEQMRPYIGRSLDAETFERIERYITGFLRARGPLFAARMAEGRILDCHGDLRLQHVYFPDETNDSTVGGVQLGMPAVIDCIEFNDRFRYSDVASEVAFLTMELDAAGRRDLARRFVRAYVARTGDTALEELLAFYSCYRACVRGKVLSFQLDQPEVSEEQRSAVQREASELFALAAGYAQAPERPQVVLIGGLMGVGKSTLAARLAAETGWQVISSDVTRKQLLAGSDHPEYRAPFGEGSYTAAVNTATYQALLGSGEVLLRGGRSVVLDASFARRADRQAARQMADALGATCMLVECECAPATALRRLAVREETRHDGEHEVASAVAASDGRVELYETQRAQWENVVADEGVGELKHLRVDTDAALPEQLSAILCGLGVWNEVCWLV